MSNLNFDNLCKRLNISDAKAALKAYETSLNRTDLTAEDIEFLNRAIEKTRERIERALHDANQP